MSTVPLTVIELVISPSVSSVAVAPGSVHESPTVSCIVDDPFKVITGGVVSSVGHVPHTGLFSFVRAEFVEKLEGSEVRFVTHHSDKS